MVAREARQLPGDGYAERANRLVGTGNRERWPAGDCGSESQWRDQNQGLQARAQSRAAAAVRRWRSQHESPRRASNGAVVRVADANDMRSVGHIGTVPANGNGTVTPTQSTTYELVAKGPGGEARQTATIDVDTQPTATLELSRPEVHYHKIGEKVVEQDSTTLNWSTSNADTITIQLLGNVNPTGIQSIEAIPEQTGTGRIDQDVTYTLSAANACGGTATRTATLHIVGSIDPAPPLTLASIFYPSNYPQRRHPKVG